ncbi:MAG: MFS transporter, partial [Chlamydiae bacterium]|nr:MFS transporter [Chlamydiota bacterium]
MRLILITILCGFQFGYHCAIIAGAHGFLAEYFILDQTKQAFAVSIILIGGLIGSLLGGILADKLGRKSSLHWTSLLLIVSTMIVSFAPSYITFLMGRILQGIGLGITTVVAPIYLAEAAISSKRGAIVSSNQFAIPLGILTAYGISYIFSSSGNWRMMFMLGAVPAVIQLIGFFFLPEVVVRDKKSLENWRTLFTLRYRKLLILG